MRYRMALKFQVIVIRSWQVSRPGQFLKDDVWVIKMVVIVTIPFFDNLVNPLLYRHPHPVIKTVKLFHKQTSFDLCS